MLRIGLIGAGWHAMADHAPALRHCAEDEEFRGRVKLSGVCDIDLAKAKIAAAQFGFRRAYDSVDVMLPDVDAVISIVPPGALAATLPSIVKHSRPVLIEKPLGRDLAEARRIAAALAGHPHMVSLNRRFDPGVALARQWLAKCAKQSPPKIVYGVMRRRDRTELDFVWSTGIHMTDLLCFLFGPLRVVNGYRVDHQSVAAARGNDDLRVLIDIGPSANSVDEYIEGYGDDWDVKITTGTHRPWQVVGSRAGSVEIHATANPATPPYIRNGTAHETAAFLRGVLSRKMRGLTAADAMPGTELAAAMQALDDAPAYHGTPQ